MKKIVGIILGLLLVATCLVGVWSQELKKEDPKNKSDEISEINITKRCASVSCGDHYGCGTIYDDVDGHFVIVTAMHVLEDYYSGVSDEILVEFDNHEECSATILKEEMDLDIVFLRTERSSISDEYYSVSDLTSNISSSSESSNNSKSDNTLLPGQTIYLVDANTSDIYAGSIASPSVYSEDFGMDMIYCYCAVTPGMSGTGLFDEEDNYLGILLGGSDEAEAVCLDASTIKDAYLN